MIVTHFIYLFINEFRALLFPAIINTEYFCIVEVKQVFSIKNQSREKVI